MPTEPADAIARLAIADLVARYCDAVARGDLGAFGACWAADGHWAGPGLDRRGAAAITAHYARLREGVVHAHQAVLAGSARVDGVDRDSATGWWWIRETIAYADGRTREVVGRYDDRYVRAAAGGWRFARRAFTPAGG